jgi:hypothetical protein
MRYTYSEPDIRIVSLSPALLLTVIKLSLSLSLSLFLSLSLSLSLSHTHTHTDDGCFPDNVGREGGSCHRLQLGRLLFLRFTFLLGPG